MISFQLDYRVSAEQKGLCTAGRGRVNDPTPKKALRTTLHGTKDKQYEYARQIPMLLLIAIKTISIDPIEIFVPV